MQYKIINRKKLYATIAADMIGSAVTLPLRLLQGHEDIHPAEIKEILVIRTAYIGDVVMTLPILKPLREKFPGARITFLAPKGAKALFENNPYVDEVLTHDPFWFYKTGISEHFAFLKLLRKKKYDLVIEARGDIREFLFILGPMRARHKVSYSVGGGAYMLTDVVPYKELKHKVQYHLDIVRHIGCEAKEIEWGLYMSNDEMAAIRGRLLDAGVTGPFVAAHPGSRLDLKRWPPDRFAHVLDRIDSELGLQVVLVATKQEKPLVDVITSTMKAKPVVFCGNLSLRELAGVIKEASAFLCHDSAPMHIAAAEGTMAVAIFGPSKNHETGPYGSIHRVVERDFSCRHTCDESHCTNERHHACMLDITEEEVFLPIKEAHATVQRIQG